MAYFAGHYTVTYDGSALGNSQDGWRWSHQVNKRPITADAFGDTVIDSIYRGLEYFLAGTLLEYNAAGVTKILGAYGDTLAEMDLGKIGKLDVQHSLVKQIVLTSVLNADVSPSVTPATRTVPLCALAENFPVEILFANDLRTVPLRFRVYPNASTGVFATDT